MTRGKNICKQLKEVRKRIAEENGIPLEMEECTYKGECRGTCPRCEAEVRYLENALAERLRIGKVATIAGLALGLAATAQAQAPQNDTVPLRDKATVRQIECRGMLKGKVLDKKTQEPIPFCNVTVKQGGKQVRGATTDFDGVYVIKPMRWGKYTIEIRAIGYKPLESEVEITKGDFTILDVSLENNGRVLSTVEIEAEGNDDYDFPMIGGVQEIELPGTPASQATPSEQPLLYEEKEQPGVRVKMLSVAALALGLAAGTAQAAGTCPAVLPEVPSIVKEAVHVSDSVTIKGTVVDARTREPVPFASVIFTNSKGREFGVATDWDGNYVMKVAKGKYTIKCACVGYEKYVMRKVKCNEDCTLPPIALVSRAPTALLGVAERHPVFMVDPYSPTQQLEKDGVKVIVR